MQDRTLIFYLSNAAILSLLLELDKLIQNSLTKLAILTDNSSIRQRLQRLRGDRPGSRNGDVGDVVALDYRHVIARVVGDAAVNGQRRDRAGPSIGAGCVCVLGSTEVGAVAKRVAVAALDTYTRTVHLWKD